MGEHVGAPPADEAGLDAAAAPHDPHEPNLHPGLTADEVAAYLARIGHPAVDAPDRVSLASLQDTHVRTVPFENLDIHLGRPLSLDIPSLFDKVVRQRRGGFCFELNGLFATLLHSLGYTAWLVEARTVEDDDQLGPRFDHARIIVELDEEPWLVDVGTGASPRGPIRLTEQAQTAGHVRYRVLRHGDRYRSEQFDGAGWTPGWTFDLHQRELDEFRDRCTYHQTSPESHFTQKPLCTLVTEDGHLTLSARTLITTRAGHRTEEVVADPLAVLRSRFEIEIPTWPGT